MAWYSKLKARLGSRPSSMQNIVLSANPTTMQPGYQEKQNWPWLPVPAHEQISALTNAWMGNQLPGPTNYIPGVPLSNFVWNVPTSYANTLKNQQYNVGMNIMGMSSVQNSSLQAAIQQAWQNRSRGI